MRSSASTRSYVLHISSNNGLKSSVTVRSNVYVRTNEPLQSDKAFVKRIHGRGAIAKALALLEVNSTDRSQLTRVLTPRQIAEWAWERRCEHCGCIPEGPVFIEGREEIRFRCPLGKCESRELLGRSVLLNPALVDRVTRRTGLPLMQTAQLILSRTDFSRVKRPTTPSTRRAPFIVALTPWQRYMLTNEDIEAALIAFEGEETSRCAK